MTPAEQLCTSCARCCNGKYFAATPLEPAEELRFGCRALRQPCPHLQPDKRCGIYSTRPAVCTTYRCKTLEQLEAGELTVDQAREQLTR